MKSGWHCELDLRGKITLLQELGAVQGSRCQKLAELGIPQSTYYRWQGRYRTQGGDGLTGRRRAPKRIWNRLSEYEHSRVLEIAKHHPELSCRLLAVKIIDEEPFSVSPTTVYRLLKQAGLVEPRPLTEMPAAKSWGHKTKRPDEIWQSDATHYFVVDWGFYKQIAVQDDYSRNPLAWDLKADETAFSISDVVEQAIKNARKLGHLQDGLMPKFLSDNGPGFTSKVLAEYLYAHGIKHIFGRPYHPQTQGKIERFHRSIKEKVCLLVYCSPGELKEGIDEAIMRYARTPHTALKNVSPLDVYMGRQEEILKRRAEKKRLTLERRKLYNMGYKKEGEQP